EEIPPLDPELPEPEVLRWLDVQDLPAGLEQRELQVVNVSGRVQIPELPGPPFLPERKEALVEMGTPHRWAREISHAATVLPAVAPERVARRRGEVLQTGIDGDLAPAHRRLDPHVADARAGWRAGE